MNPSEYQEWIDECLADENREIEDQIMVDEEHGL